MPLDLVRGPDALNAMASRASQRIAEWTLILAVAVDGTRVAVFRCMTLIRSSSRDRQRTDSRVPLPRVSVANVRPRSHRGDSFDLLGVGTLTLPPPSPPHAGRWGGSVSWWNRSSSSAPTSGCRRLELTTARRAPLLTPPETDGSKARVVREFERPSVPRGFAVVGQTAVARISAVCVATRRWIEEAPRSRNRGCVPPILDTNIARVASLLLDAWHGRAQRLRRNTSRLIRKSPRGEME